jgi:hypothetical protein
MTEDLTPRIVVRICERFRGTCYHCIQTRIASTSSRFFPILYVLEPSLRNSCSALSKFDCNNATAVITTL